MATVKPFDIPKQLVWEAYLRVKRNAGAAGVDSESIEDFERNLKNNLYRLWNRMSSGSYFPPPVLQVGIPKRDGGERKLGIPTVTDRIAQAVVKLYLEPFVEPSFHEDSYGYRPRKSAHEAVAKARERCWRYNRVLDLDVQSLQNPDVPVDTNHLERQVRPVALGRRNWLFCWTEVGAKYVGIIHSLLATCRLQKVDPYTYLVDVLQRIETHPARDVHLLTPRMWKQHFASDPLRSDLDRIRQHSAA